MEVVKSSVFCRLLTPFWLYLTRVYDYSVLASVQRGISGAWKRACSGSVLVGFLAREGVLSRGWKHSLFCRGLTGLLSLPTILLQWIYRRGEVLFENSVAARIVFAVVEQTPLTVGWLMLAFMVIPYDNWNNSYSFMGFVLCLILAMAAGMRKPDYRMALADLGPWLIAFAGFVVVAWPLSIYRNLSGRFLVFHVTCMLCVLVLVTTVERKEQLERLLGVSSLAMIVMSLCGLWQRIQGVEVNPSYVDLTVNQGMPGRVFGFYENPNAFGEVLLMLLPLAIALMLCSRSWGGRFLGLVSTGMGCMAIAMTYSRAAWIGLVVALFLFVFLWNRKLIPAAIVIGIAGLSFLPDTVFHRILTIFNTSDTSTTSRFPYYQAAGELLRMRPLTGAGLGTDAVRKAIAQLHLFHGKDLFVHCHDIYLQVWCETGIFGLITFVGGILWTFKRGVSAAAAGLCSRQTRLTVIGGVSALMGTMVCGIADYIWNYPRVMLIFWFVCGLSLAGIRLAARENGPADLPPQKGEYHAIEESLE